MAVAIRTKKPLDLHLAPWVWKQMCCIPLGAGDLEEVDLLTYRSLQGILHLDNSVINEENFTVVRHTTPRDGRDHPFRLEFLTVFYFGFADDPSGLVCGSQC